MSERKPLISEECMFRQTGRGFTFQFAKENCFQSLFKKIKEKYIFKNPMSEYYFFFNII